MMKRNSIWGLILAIVAALLGGRAMQRRRGASGIGGNGGDLGGLLGGLGGEQPSGGTGKLRDTEGKPVQEV